MPKSKTEKTSKSKTEKTAPPSPRISNRLSKSPTTGTVDSKIVWRSTARTRYKGAVEISWENGIDLYSGHLKTKRVMVVESFSIDLARVLSG